LWCLKGIGGRSRKMAVKRKFKNVIRLSFTLMIILALLIAGNESLLSLLIVYIVFLGISILAYTSKTSFRKDLIRLKFDKSLWVSVSFAVVLGIGFYFATRFIPFFQIGLPLTPGSISSTLRGWIINVFAPIIESVFLQSVVYAVWKSFHAKTALIGQAIVFAFAHVAAYVSGFYSYPNFTEGFSAVYANLGGFIAAFTFALLAMFITLRKRINNLAFTILFHAVLNFIIFTTLVVIF